MTAVTKAGTPVLIATLGTEPQVVTSTLDLLVARGIEIRFVQVLHTYSQDPPIVQAIEILKEEFSRSTGNARFQAEFIGFKDEYGVGLADIESPRAIHSAFKLLYRLVREAKRAGQIVHLSIAGGRKTSAIFGMVTAQLLFDDADRLWYLYSSGEFLSSKRLHPRESDEVSLVQVPVILWRQVSPALMELNAIEDPFEAIERIKGLRLKEITDRARSFVLDSLTPAERRVVEALVRGGLSDQEIAANLSISPRTVEQHLRSAYAKAAVHWGFEAVGRTQLVALLQLYFAVQIGENPHDRRC